jgi:formate hydrogenlyase transcriptional activator
MGREVPAIPIAAMRALQQWKWPGNIRELQNVIERAVILTTGPNLQLPFQDLAPKSRRAASGAKAAPTLKDAERDAILSALRDSGGVIAGPKGAAARLGLRRTTLHSKMRKLGIDRPSY